MFHYFKAILCLLAVWAIPGYATSPCPTFWTAWRGHCYRYFGDEVSWSEAMKTCRLFSAGTDGIADLVSIHSTDEHNFLYSFWLSSRQHDSRTSKPGMWIGLTDFEENGVHRWSDGTNVDYTNFDTNQEATGDQYRYLLYDYPASNARGKWHDIFDSTDWYFQFMCKMRYA